MNAAGTALIYSTYLGGDNEDWGNSIAVDESGNAYVTGSTESSDFPTTSLAYQPTISDSHATDSFLTKLNANGSSLVYSTYYSRSGYAFAESSRVAVNT